jgi:small GTP-binding protein
MAKSIEEQIRELEEEISNTKYNKATQGHIGKLKAKIARLGAEQEKRQAKASGGGKGYQVRKSGNATVALVGFPSVGKSTLLNRLTGANSEVGSYNFTTLDVVPGVLDHMGAQIQILDLPGLIRDASRGKGRGREVISAVRSSDLILFVVDVFDSSLDVLVRELEHAAIRMNQKPPDVVITKTERGGITVKSTIGLTKMDEELAKAIVGEYGLINADVVIREDIDPDQLVDVLAGNRIYIKALVAINKVDLAEDWILERAYKRLNGYEKVPVSAREDEGMDRLKDAIFEQLDLIRVYMKPQGQEADMDEPMVIRKGSSIGDVCDSIHRNFRPNFRYANIWGRSAKFPGQMVGLDHIVADGDVISIIVKRG